jgi:hypothetical protein
MDSDPSRTAVSNNTMQVQQKFHSTSVQYPAWNCSSIAVHPVQWISIHYQTKRKKVTYFRNYTYKPDLHRLIILYHIGCEKANTHSRRRETEITRQHVTWSVSHVLHHTYLNICLLGSEDMWPDWRVSTFPRIQLPPPTTVMVAQDPLKSRDISTRHTARRHNPEYTNLHIHSRENLKISHMHTLL